MPVCPQTHFTLPTVHKAFNSSPNPCYVQCPLTFTTMTTLPCLRPTATAEAAVSWEVLSVVMISSSCILSTGEK